MTYQFIISERGRDNIVFVTINDPDANNTDVTG
jgi:hypothetical protein